MKKCLLIVNLFFALLANGQITFQKIFGGERNGYSVQQTTDGGFIVVGSTESDVNIDICLIKTDVNGDAVWRKTYGGSNNDYGYSVLQTTDGGFIIAGQQGSYSSGESNVYLIKTDINGDTLWTKGFGGSNYDYGLCVQQTSDGGFIIAGFTTSFGAGSNDAYLIKTDFNGNLIWTRIYGGSSSDIASFVQQTDDGGFIFTGSTESFGAGERDIYMIRTDASGNTLWTRTFGGGDYDFGNSIQQTTDGGFIIAGYTQSFGSGVSDAYLVKTNSSGDMLWTRAYGGTNSDIASSVQQTSDGGFIIVGSAQSFIARYSDMYLIKTNVSGNLIWSKTFVEHPSAEGNSVQQTVDGGFVIVGQANAGPHSSSLYLIKTDSLGNSGCYEANPQTIQNNTSTIQANTITSTSIVNSQTSSLATTVGNLPSMQIDLCFSQTYIEETESDFVLNIFPNPSTGKFTIQYSEKISSIEISNLLGEKIYSATVNSKQETVNLSSHPKGIYFVEIICGNPSSQGYEGQVERVTKKIILQ